MHRYLIIITMIITSRVLISIHLWNISIIEFLLVSFFCLLILLLLTLFCNNLLGTRVYAKTGAARFKWLVISRIRSISTNFTRGPLYSLLTRWIHLAILLLKLINQPITRSNWIILPTSYNTWIEASSYYFLFWM